MNGCLNGQTGKPVELLQKRFVINGTILKMMNNDAITKDLILKLPSPGHMSARAAGNTASHMKCWRRRASNIEIFVEFDLSNSGIDTRIKDMEFKISKAPYEV